MSNGTTIVVADSTEQDAEYQVTPGPPPLEDELPTGPPPWVPIRAGESQNVPDVTLPVRVTFRVANQQPNGVITLGKTTATLLETGGAFRVQVS